MAEVNQAAKASPKAVPPQSNKVKTPKAPEKQPNSIMIGGIKYNPSDIKKSSVDKAMIASFDGYREGEKYEVILKDGTKLNYDSVKYEDNSSAERENLERQAEVQMEQDGTVNFKGLYNVDITDTPKDDKYRLLGCKFTNIDADRVEETKPGAVDALFGAKSEFKSADSDKIVFGNRVMPDGSVQATSNSIASLQPGDKVHQLNRDGTHDYFSEIHTKEINGEVNPLYGQSINEKPE